MLSAESTLSEIFRISRKNPASTEWTKQNSVKRTEFGY
jgi:hypothetical protein